MTTHALVCYLRDGASTNRFFIYNNLQNDNTDIRFKTIKLYARYRNIYFIFYASHLIKTARNCLHNPDGGKHLRHMCNNEKYLLWEYIVKIYHEDLDNGLKILPKISNKHVNLTSYSGMTVKYVVKVLSKTMFTTGNRIGNENGSPNTSDIARIF